MTKELYAFELVTMSMTKYIRDMVLCQNDTEAINQIWESQKKELADIFEKLATM